MILQKLLSTMSSNVLFLTVSFILFLHATACSQNASNDLLGNGHTQKETHIVMDPHMGNLPMGFYRFEAGWTINHEVAYTWNGATPTPNLTARGRSNDGLSTYELWPSENYQYNAQIAALGQQLGSQPISMTPYMTPTRYLKEAVLPYIGDGFTPLEEKILGGKRTSVGHMIQGYIAGKNGKGENQIFFVQQFINGNPSIHFWTAQVQTIRSSHLDVSSMVKIIWEANESFQMNRTWEDLYNQLVQNGISSNAALAQRINQMNMQSYRESSDILRSNYENNSSAQDDYAQRFSDVILDQERLVDSEGQEHVVDNYYDYYYHDGSYEYLGTNDPNYDPNMESSNPFLWEELTPKY